MPEVPRRPDLLRPPFLTPHPTNPMNEGTKRISSKRLLYEVRVLFGAMNRLLMARIVTQDQLGKAMKNARREWRNTKP